MFDAINTSVFIIAILNLLLGVLIFFQAPKNLATRVFSVVIILIFTWQISMFFYRGVRGVEEGILWARLLYITASTVPTIFAFFTYLFPYKHTITRWKVISLYLVNTLLIMLILHPTYIIQNVMNQEHAEKVIVWGPLYFLYVLYIPLTFGLGYFQLFKTYFSTAGQVRLQLRFVIFGTLSTMTLAAVTNLFLPSFGIFNLNWLGQDLTILLVGSITYAIVRHRLMDIRLAIRAFILRFILASIVAGVIYLGSQVFITRILYPSPQNIAIFATTGAFGLVLVYDFLSKIVRYATDSFLFQREYNRQELLKDLGKALSESISLGDLQQRIREALQEAMRVERVEFQFKDQASGAIWQQVQQKPEMIVYDELIREIENLKDGLIKSRLEIVRDRMSDDKTAVVMPLLTSEGVTGMVLLGEKKGGDAYTSADLDALETLMYQAGVATENALLFKETQDFNIRLQDEVKKATNDLKIRNRRLTVLRKLDQIILNTLNIRELGQKVVDLVSWEMGFHGAFLVLIEESKGKKWLRPVALSSTPIFNAALKLLPKTFTKYILPWGLDPSNLYYRSINERQPLATDDFRDLYVPPLSAEMAKSIQQITQSKSVVVYPLSARGVALGAISFDLPKPYAELSIDEKELIESYIDELGIAIENRKLYAELQEKNVQLKDTNARLKELDQMKDELVSVASHELRTPMTVIKSYLWMALNKQADSLNESLKKYLERAYLSSERMINLVNDMLSASRLEGKRVELNMQPADIRRIINDVVVNLVTKANEKSLQLSFNPPDGEFPDVLLDEPRMIEILVNLIGNAIKYTPQGRIWVEVSTHDQSGPEEPKDPEGKHRYMWIEVKDTGEGIAQEDMAKLFKKFGKLETGSFTKTAETGGTGLGLYITKELVTLHGGKIWVNSEIGKGSTFAFSVQLAG